MGGGMEWREDSLDTETFPNPCICQACAEIWGPRNGSNLAPPLGSSGSGEAAIVLHPFKHEGLGLWAATPEGWQGPNFFTFS